MNQLIPTLIIKELKDNLIAPKFIIHVTSLEGQFNMTKTDKHFHTNMCKAVMNMLIKTLENDEDKNLNVHAISPSYISGITTKERTAILSQEDGATRITWPIFMLMNNKKLGKKYTNINNYKPCPW